MVRLYTKLSRREMEYNTLIVEATEKGLKEGIEQGIEQNNLEVAKKMLEENIEVETISKITGLTKEEIAKLK